MCIQPCRKESTGVSLATCYTAGRCKIMLDLKVLEESSKNMMERFSDLESASRFNWDENFKILKLSPVLLL